MNHQRNFKIIIIAIVIIAILLCIGSFFLGGSVMNRSRKGVDTINSSPTPAITKEATITPNPTNTTAPTVAPTETTAPTDSPSLSNNMTYKNTQYGFDFKLPASWEGYRILADSWQGTAVSGEGQGQIVETGIKIIIRHPEWTKDNPRQDIPIMVFTKEQWNKIEKESLAVSAAPMGPSKLGSNSKYVFALPARYNYAFPTGYEEVDKILNSKALVPNENIE